MQLTYIGNFLTFQTVGWKLGWRDQLTNNIGKNMKKWANMLTDRFVYSSFTYNKNEGRVDKKHFSNWKKKRPVKKCSVFNRVDLCL